MNATDSTYEKFVKEVFGVKSMRTALLIDDEFPTFARLLGRKLASPISPKQRKKGSDQDGSEFDNEPPAAWQTCLELYESLQRRHLLCDVLDKAPDEETQERVRKSDLVILDYHLQGNDNDEHSRKLLVHLADTPHFNTVVLYTNELALQKVWLRIACDLRGGWKDSEKLLSGSGDLSEVYDELVEEKLVSEEHLLGFFLGPSPQPQEVLPPDFVPRFQGRFTGVTDSEAQQKLTEALLNQAGRKDGIASPDRKKELLTGSCKPQAYWIQCKNLFLVIANKSETTPENLVEVLDSSLLSWGPSYLKVILSMVQNRLETTQLATESKGIVEPQLEVGLGNYLLEYHFLDGRKGATGAAGFLLQQIAESIQMSLSTDSDLLELVTDLLSSEVSTALGETKLTKDKQDQVHTFAQKLSRNKTGVREREARLRVNAFLNAVSRAGSEMTSGTIFRSKGESKVDYFVCVSPACDLVSGRQVANQWCQGFEPHRPFLAILLSEHPKDQRIKATSRDFVFWHFGTETYFKVVEPQQTEVFIHKDFDDAPASENSTFFAYRLVGKKESDSPSLELIKFELLAQLRPSYCDRLLQAVGSNLSRIGVDFVNVPK